MKKIILLAIINFLSHSLFAQNDSILNTEIDAVKSHLIKLSSELESLQLDFTNQNKSLDYFRNILSKTKDDYLEIVAKVDTIENFAISNREMLISESQVLESRIEQRSEIVQSNLSALNNDLENSRLYWIIVTLTIVLIWGLVAWVLGKRITSSKTDIETQINSTKKSLEEESIKLDSKLVEVLESQLKIHQAESSSAISNPVTEKEDHSLALKVADEIVRMQKNISRMDEGIKGLKPLEKGIERIQSNFAANGYEMVNLLNKDYEDRMNLDVINFLEDYNLEKGKKIITKIIKPQVNFNGVLIQRAQVEVSQN
jgi:hypothetical protein